MSDFREYLDEQLRDPEFRAEYEAIQAATDDRFESDINQAWLTRAIEDYEAGRSTPIIKSMEELERIEKEA